VNKFKQQIDREDIRAMESRGSNSLSRILNQLASEPRQDELSIEEFMEMKYELQKREYLKNNPGKTEEDYKEEIIKLSLKDGGSVIDLSKYRKDKEPVEVKEIDLASLFTPGKTLASLTEKEKDVVNQMLRLTLGKK
tara:strand:+ start:895 stop:1305 length:411 start_codon:yes stop_codon:yes gene_type:complete